MTVSKLFTDMDLYHQAKCLGRYSQAWQLSASFMTEVTCVLTPC